MASVQAEPYEFELDPATSALVIIDMQRDFVDPGGFGEALGNDVSLLRKAIAPTRRVLDAARSRGLLVIHTREGHRPDLSDLHANKKLRGRLAAGIGDKGPMGRILVRGEYGHDIVDELKPAAGEPVVDKPGKGAFYATDLDAMLHSRGIRQLVVCGVTTEVCVNTTVREANDRGYDCLVLEDCVDPASLLPAIGGGLVTLGRLQVDVIALRLLILAGGPFRAAHARALHSLPALAGNLASMFAGALMLARALPPCDPPPPGVTPARCPQP